MSNIILKEQLFTFERPVKFINALSMLKKLSYVDSYLWIIILFFSELYRKFKSVIPALINLMYNEWGQLSLQIEILS